MDSEENSSWKYNPEISAEAYQADSASPGTKDEAPITWTASEYIDHENGLGWYGALTLGTLLLAAGVYTLTKDYLATGTVAVVGIIIGIAALRRPQQISYELSGSDLKIGDKTYSYKTFKSFHVAQEGGLRSIGLMPLKRFMPALSIYFEPADEKKITERLSQHLPYEEHKTDSIEKLTRRLRF